jgi:cold shock CspA family protein
MFIEGKVKTYNAERGFGFIETSDGEKNLFFHISDVPFRHILPSAGERLKFRKTIEQGKPKAIDILRLDFKTHSEPKKYINSQNNNQRKRYKQKQKTENNFDLLGIMTGAVIVIILFFVLKPIVLGIYNRSLLRDQPVTQSSNITSKEPVISNQTENFKCDGRVHCSQMRSYEEAVYFINNCPGTKMDGDRDGIPCERQF